MTDDKIETKTAWYCTECNSWSSGKKYFNSKEELLKVHPVLETCQYLIATKEINVADHHHKVIKIIDDDGKIQEIEYYKRKK